MNTLDDDKNGHVTLDELKCALQDHRREQRAKTPSSRKRFKQRSIQSGTLSPGKLHYGPPDAAATENDLREHLKTQRTRSAPALRSRKEGRTAQMRASQRLATPFFRSGTSCTWELDDETKLYRREKASQRDILYQEFGCRRLTKQPGWKHCDSKRERIDFFLKKGRRASMIMLTGI